MVGNLSCCQSIPCSFDFSDLLVRSLHLSLCLRSLAALEAKAANTLVEKKKYSNYTK